MSSRNYLQWELVGEGSDPVPASESDVDRVADTFRDQGNEMENAASLLKKVANLEGFTGKAATQLADKASDAHSDLGKAADKYQMAAEALYTFAGAVATARTETAAAVSDAVEAHGKQTANAHSLLDGVDDPTDAQKDADQQRSDNLDAAVSAMGAARTRLQNALGALDTAAGTAASAIGNASEKFKDSRMDNIKGAVSSALKVFVDALNVLAIILAVVIIVLLVIGTGGAFLAFLVTVAFGVGIAILAGTSIQFLMGDADKTDLAFAVIGAFGGKLLSAGGKAAAKSLSAAKAMQVARLTSQTQNSMSIYVKFGKRIPIKFISNFAKGIENKAVTKVLSDFEGQLGQLKSTSRLLAGLELNDATTTLRQVNALRNMNPTPAMTSALNKSLAQLAVAGTGATGTFVAQFRDGLQFPDALGNTFDNISDGIKFLQAHPPTVQPINVNIGSVGR